MGLKISGMTSASLPLIGDELIELSIPDSDPLTRSAPVSAIPGNRFVFMVAVSDETTAIASGTAKISFPMPAGVTLTEVRAWLTTVQASGSAFTVDVNEGGASIMSTKLTIDNTEHSSATAATPAVISDASIAEEAMMTIDVDQIGDGTAKGLKITFIGTYD